MNGGGESQFGMGRGVGGAERAGTCGGSGPNRFREGKTEAGGVPERGGRQGSPRSCSAEGDPSGLAGVERAADLAEERLKRTDAGAMAPDAASGLADARAEFEDTRAQRFDLRGAQGRRQAQPKQVDEVVREAVQEQ